MAIFSSYVKLPEGNLHMFLDRNRRVLPPRDYISLVDLLAVFLWASQIPRLSLKNSTLPSQLTPVPQLGSGQRVPCGRACADRHRPRSYVPDLWSPWLHLRPPRVIAILPSLSGFSLEGQSSSMAYGSSHNQLPMENRWVFPTIFSQPRWRFLPGRRCPEFARCPARQPPPRARMPVSGTPVGSVWVRWNILPRFLVLSHIWASHKYHDHSPTPEKQNENIWK